MQKLPDVLPIRLVPQRELPELLAGLSEELVRRQKDAGGEPMFLFLHGLQRLRDLRRADDDFGYSSRRGEEKPSPAKMFINLLREGPPLGISRSCGAIPLPTCSARSTARRCASWRCACCFR